VGIGYGNQYSAQATGWKTEGSGFDFRQEQEICMKRYDGGMAKVISPQNNLGVPRKSRP
jgi:hypothetical protein